MSRYPSIEETLLTKITPGITPDKLIQAVRAVHPEATKKEIIHAAFVAVIVLAEVDPERAQILQDFALRNRAS